MMLWTLFCFGGGGLFFYCLCMARYRLARTKALVRRGAAAGGPQQHSTQSAACAINERINERTGAHAHKHTLLSKWCTE